MYYVTVTYNGETSKDSALFTVTGKTEEKPLVKPEIPNLTTAIAAFILIIIIAVFVYQQRKKSKKSRKRR